LGQFSKEFPLGEVMRILIFIRTGSRIKQQQQKRRGNKLVVCLTFFFRHKFNKTKIILFFVKVDKKTYTKEKNWTKNYNTFLFYRKNCH